MLSHIKLNSYVDKCLYVMKFRVTKYSDFQSKL